MPSPEMERRRKKIFYELLVVIVLGVAAWIVEYTFDFHEALTAWETRNHIKGVDETLVAISVLGLALAVFSYRRWRELQSEIQEREKAQAELHTLLGALEARVQERTADLLEANRQLRAEISQREQSEDRYRDLVNNSRDLICTHDLEGRILSLNPYAEQILGYEVGDLLDTNIRDLVIPAARKFFDTYLSELINNGIAEGTMLVQTKKGGKRIWKYRNTLRTEGVPEPVVRGMAQDITEQRQAESALRDSERRFHQLFDISPDAILLIDPHDPDVPWPIMDCNEAACSMNGYTREEIVGQSIDLLNGVQDTPGNRAGMLERMRNEGVVHMEALHQHKDGHFFPVEISTSLFTAGGRELILGIDRDISDRKLAEETLEKNERRFRALVEHSTDAITLLNSEGIALYDSPAAPGMLGYGPEEMIGQSIFELVHPDDLIDILPQFQELTETPGARVNATFRVRHKSGSWRWIESTTTNLLTEPSVKAIVANYRDITERKQAEEALKESERRFRSLFENSPVSIWEEDFSEVKAYLDNLKDVALPDFKTYLADHPEVVSECAGLVKILDVNKASLNLYGAQDKSILLNSPSAIIPDETFDTFQQELSAIWRGERSLTLDGVARTLEDERRDVTIIWAVAPGSEDSYARVLVSLIDITERRLAEEEIRTRRDELSALYELSRALAEANDLDTVLDLVSRQAVESVHTTFARIALLEGDQLVTRSAYQIRALEHNLFVGNRNSITALPRCLQALDQDEPVMLRASDPGVSEAERAALLLDFTQSVFVIPLKARDFEANSSRSLGLLILGEARSEKREPFTPEKLRLARSIGDQAATAIDKTRLFNDLQRSNRDLNQAYDATILGWSAALDLRDKETEGHTQRVTEMTIELAKKMGISDQDLIHIRRGALLHDIGKMGVPDRILLKPDKLTDEEWKIMRLHPVYAYQMLEPISYLGPALDIPYCHHEKWDGTGYPRGLKGEQIPLSARIFAIVDVYDALTSDRPYRAGWSKEKTLKHIRESSGSHFDPSVVEAFLKILNRRKHKK